MRATLTGAIWQMFGTAFALWIPCLPIFFLMRNALNSKAGNKCARVHPVLAHLAAATVCVPVSCSSFVAARLMLCCGGRLGLLSCRANDAKSYRLEPDTVAMLRYLSARWRAAIPWPSRYLDTVAPAVAPSAWPRLPAGRRLRGRRQRLRL